jgi:predicted DNA-binding transcriptional regulator AlpA
MPRLLIKLSCVNDDAKRRLPQFLYNEPKPEENMDKLITQKQFRTNILGISSATFWRLAKAGELPQSLKIGRRSYWTTGDIEHWLAAKKESKEK